MQYSKVLPIVTGIIFLGCLFLPIYFSGIDTSIFVSAIGISGSIFGSSIIFYLKKAQVENTYKIKISLYEKAAEICLNFNVKMTEIKHKYGEIDGFKDLDDIMGDSFSDVSQTVNNAMDDASSPVDLHNY